MVIYLKAPFKHSTFRAFFSLNLSFLVCRLNIFLGGFTSLNITLSLEESC